MEKDEDGLTAAEEDRRETTARREVVRGRDMSCGCTPLGAKGKIMFRDDWLF